MVPRTDHKEVLLLRIVAFEQFIDLDGAVEVFLVPPTGDVQCRDGYASEPRLKSLSFPERVVIRMTDEIVPGGKLAVEELRIGIRKWSKVQIPLVGVVAIDDVCGIGDLFRRLHHVGVFESVTETNRPVVM